MANSDDMCAVGFGNPPKHTRFSKGQSGNPLGRPRGSKNAATILQNVCRERIRVNVNGRVRYISKFEASMLQLMNKASSGDLRAIQNLLSWITSLQNSEQVSAPPPIVGESDSLTMASIVGRILESARLVTEAQADSQQTPSTPEVRK